jgi:hypothetical protein
MPDPPQAERNAGLTLQPGLQLGQRQIGLRCDPIHHLTLRLGPGPQLTPRPVWHTLGLPCAVPLCRNLLRPAHAYQKAIRKFRQRFLASIVGQQKFSAQIIPIWLRHRFTRRRVSPIGVYIIKENALDLEDFFASLKQGASWVQPEHRLQASPDEADNRFLECAETVDAEFLITGNKRHFPKTWKGTKVVNAREFLGQVVPL